MSISLILIISIIIFIGISLCCVYMFNKKIRVKKSLNCMQHIKKYNDIEINIDRISEIKRKYEKTSEIKFVKQATKEDVEEFYKSQTDNK